MKHKNMYCKILACVLFLCTIFSLTPMVKAETTTEYNYAEALQLSLYFYDANRCGSGITGAAITWRGDCHTYDAYLKLDTENTNLSQDFINKYKNILDSDGDGTIDVSGGFHDAGDHVKCAQTNGFVLANLNLGLYEFPEAYSDTNAFSHLQAIIKDFCDYIMKCTYIDENGDVIAFCYQVADTTDHSYWEAPETQTIKRPAYFVYEGNYGTEQVMECAAGLAATAVNFKNTDKAYADKCLEYAKALYNFGMKYKGSTPASDKYIYATINGYEDETAWAEAWLYLATGEQEYLDKAKNANMVTGWVHSWDNNWARIYSINGRHNKRAKIYRCIS